MMHLKIALLFAAVAMWVSADIGERKGVTISLKGEGTDLMLATREDLGSFWCGKTCELVFTTHSGSDTVWNITPFKQGDENCYEIVKGSGYHAGEVMTANSDSIWEAPFGDGNPKLFTAKIDGEDKCWEFEHVGGDSYKIKKKLGSVAGKTVKARPINFKEETVSKERRFVEVSDDDTYNVWEIKNA